MRTSSLRAAFGIACGLLCSAAIPAAASATSYTITGTGLDPTPGGINGWVNWTDAGGSHSEAAGIGRILLTGTDNSGHAANLEVYCVDIKDWLGNGTFVAKDPSTYLTADQITKVTKFLAFADNQVNTLNTAVASAAAQLGVWEILNETSGSYDLTSGSFSVGVYDNNAILDAAGLAKQWLDGMSHVRVTGASLAFIDPGAGNQPQAYITTQSESIVVGVPEPGTWALTVVGFGALGAMLRRRKPDALTA
jgi:hypothetical protein